MTIRINWVSEIQSDTLRRSALLALYPVCFVWNVAVYAVLWTFHLAVLLLALPCVLWRAPRLLNRATALRWSHAKPRGEKDWVSLLLDSEERA